MSNNDPWVTMPETDPLKKKKAGLLVVALVSVLIVAVVLIIALQPRSKPEASLFSQAQTEPATPFSPDVPVAPTAEPDVPVAPTADPTPVVSAPDEPWVDGDWDWTLADGVLTIRGTGNVTRYPDFYTSAPWSSSSSDVIELVVEEGITGIGGGTFYSLTNLRSASLPASLRNFEGSAFFGCRSLETIQVAEGSEYLLSVDGVLYSRDMKTILCYPENKAGEQYRISNQVTSIGCYAFASSQNLRRLDIPGGVTEIQDYAFYCSQLTELALPASVTRFGSCAFCGSCLTGLELPADLTEIGDRAFLNCHSLERIRIPAGVLSIGASAFSCCDKLPEIPVDAANPNYVSVDGVLYTRDMKTLLCYPAGKEGGYYRIPDGVSTIEYWAFGDCSNLTEVVIPFGVEYITRVFSGCRNLTAVHIPESVTYIGYDTFFLCDKLTDVYYGGTQTSWSAINVDNSNDALLTTTIHFNTN